MSRLLRRERAHNNDRLSSVSEEKTLLLPILAVLGSSLRARPCSLLCSVRVLHGNAATRGAHSSGDITKLCILNGIEPETRMIRVDQPLPQLHSNRYYVLDQDRPEQGQSPRQ